MNPPKQVSLMIQSFPTEARAWAAPLVEAFNQLSLETTQAISTLIQTQSGGTAEAADSGARVSKTITLTTGAVVADSFPIDFPVAAIIKGVVVSMILDGAPSGAVTVVAQMLSGGRILRVSNITGLAANTHYSIRLSLEQ